MPVVSVIIPAFNRARFIEAAARSVLAQTCEALELLIVDDGSADDTAEVARRLAAADERVRLLGLATNRGAQAARNLGIRQARAEWIAFLDSDDTWYPDSLERRLAAAEASGAPVVHSACVVRRPDQELEPFAVPALQGAVYAALLRAPGPVFPALLVRRRALWRIGYLDESLWSWQEWDTSIRLARRHRFAWVGVPTFIYDRSHGSTISADLGANARGYERVLAKHVRSILLRCGPRTVAAHYDRLAEYYEVAGDATVAATCRRRAGLWWPEAPRRVVRALRRMLLSHR